ncbi:MAG: leucine-rich repeat domain-containing protein, partial [Bacteroidaceae bacterium]|nr:leucine-rich repeat domain-containing protein [Bacteroidaceae bacterium]
SVKTIGDEAFLYCNSLASITFGNGIESVGSRAFASSIATVNIADLSAWCKINFENVEANPVSISEKLYLNGELVTDLVVPNDVTEIGSYVFYYCKALKSIIIPDNVTSIGKGAFGNCSKAEHLSLGDGLATIGDYAFYGCKNIVELVIPEGVESIGAGAFDGCIGVTVITLPSTLLYVGEDAFLNVYSLDRLYISDIHKWCNIDFVNENSNPMCNADNIYIDNVAVTRLELPSGIKSIGNYAFYGASGVLDNGYEYNLVIPEGVTSIGNSAFESFKMSAITLPSTLETIGNRAFSNCKNFHRVNIPQGVTTIGDEAFEFCYLHQIELPNSLTTIGASAFYNCSGLNCVEIPNSVTAIGASAFEGCLNLTDVTIGSNVRSIGNSAFSSCSKIANVTSHIPGTQLFTLGNNVFDYTVTNNSTLYVRKGSSSYYKSQRYWSNFKNIVEFEPITVSAAGYATLYLGKAVEIPAGVEVYTANAVDGDLLKMQLVEGAIPANTGVIVKAAAGTYYFKGVGYDVPAIKGNLFRGSIGNETISVPNGKAAYVLSMVDGEVGMYRAALTDGAFLNNANKAYLLLGGKNLGIYDEEYDTSGQLSNGFRFDFSGITGIDSIPAEGFTGIEGVYYDLTGRVVENPANGVYIINGKKVLVK